MGTRRQNGGVQAYKLRKHVVIGPDMVNPEFEPTDEEEAVLDVMREEWRANPYLIRERADLGKGTVNTALTRLTSAGWVRKVTRGLYEFVDDPRTPSEEPAPTTADADLGAGASSTPTPGFTPESVLALEYDRELTDARADVLIEFVEWVAGRDEGIEKSDFETEFWSDDRENRTGYNAGSFWEAFAKAAMRQLDAFDKPNSRSYRFVEQE